IDMKSPGITPRPITTIAGDDEFSEIFFEDVRVPRENMVGDPGNGWRIANAVLVHERLKTGHPRYCQSALARTRKVAKVTGAFDSAAFRNRLAGLKIDVLAYTALFDHAVELTKQSQASDIEASIMKIKSLDILHEIVDLLVEAAGSSGPITGRFETPDGPVDVTDLFLQSRHETIRGGTSQILRNVVAKRGLGLPS
ncbi:MAG TPA: acyl-CoA dehydrogenase family protein, partial [Rhodospirillales bacterium]|nr:acyl-CoA dehydrogenase family protein [Rhodospirillales bacterium]